MNSTNNENKTTWSLDTNSLDDWLENDLRQSSLFQRRKPSNSSTKCSLSHIISQEPTASLQKEENVISIKNESQYIIEMEPQQQEPTHTSLPSHLIPLIKVYSLLNTIRQNEKLVKENKHHMYNNNNTTTVTTAAASAPPSPIMSIDSSTHSTTVNNNDKKKKVNNRVPVDLIVKRQRNTDAARRSRLRKAVKMETLENQVNTLKTDNERLRVKVAVLETGICHATEKEQRNRQRVLELEAQLANAHKQLVEEYKK